MTIARLPFSPKFHVLSLIPYCRSLVLMHLRRGEPEAREDVVEIGQRVGVDRRERRSHARRRDHAAQVIDVLAQRQIDARLVFEADDRQVLVEHLGGAVAIAGRELA